jgi:predicted RNase H-like HicB family nuclease
MKRIRVNISWCDKNYGASVGSEVPGAIVVTDKTLEGVKNATKEAVSFHIEGMLADGDSVPVWLAKGKYSFEWILDASALVHDGKRFVPLV